MSIQVFDLNSVTCFLNDKYKNNFYIFMKGCSAVAVIFESLHRSMKQNL